MHECGVGDVQVRGSFVLLGREHSAGRTGREKIVEYVQQSKVGGRQMVEYVQQSKVGLPRLKLPHPHLSSSAAVWCGVCA